MERHGKWGPRANQIDSAGRLLLDIWVEEAHKDMEASRKKLSNQRAATWRERATKLAAQTPGPLHKWVEGAVSSMPGHAGSGPGVSVDPTVVVEKSPRALGPVVDGGPHRAR